MNIALPLPLPVRYALAVLATAAAVLNQTTFDPGAPWHTYLTIALVFLAYLGIVPVLGPAFQKLLEKILPEPWVLTIHAIVAAGLGALTLALTTIHSWSTVTHAVAAGVLTALTSIGFGPPTSVAMLGKPHEVVNQTPGATPT